jgi:hypothetical protein
MSQIQIVAPVFLTLFLAVIFVLWFLDRRRTRRVDTQLESLRTQVAGLGTQVADLTRAVAALNPSTVADRPIGFSRPASTGAQAKPSVPDERIERIARDGDRGAINPGDKAELPSAQADEDEDDRETPDQGTRMWQGKPRKRPTLLTGVAGSPQGDERRSEDTLVSAGTLPADPDDGSVVVEAQHLDGTPLSERHERSSPPPSGPRQR